MTNPPPEHPLSLTEGFLRSGIDFDRAWTEYLAMGGNESRQRIRAVLDGHEALGAGEHNKLAAALNEHFVEMGGDHPVECKELPGEHE